MSDESLRRPPALSARWSHRFALLLSGSTVVLLVAGALVTSTGSSLAVPDWPLAYGELFPPLVGGIFYEHGHRLIAASVGLLTLLLAGWLLWVEPRGWVRWLGVGALGLVIFQGVLGGLTVIFLLPKPISISHAVCAQLFFVMTIVLSQVTASGWRSLTAPAAQPEPRGLTTATNWAVATLVVLLVQLVLGATVRHHGAGLAIPDFPLAYGGVLPPLELLGAFPVLIHFLHRLGALVVLVLVGITVWRTYGSMAALRRPALAMAALVVMQVLLGGLVIWSRKSVEVTTVHLVIGALLLAATVLLVLRALALGGWSSGPRGRKATAAGEP